MFSSNAPSLTRKWLDHSHVASNPQSEFRNPQSLNWHPAPDIGHLFFDRDFSTEEI